MKLYIFAVMSLDIIIFTSDRISRVLLSSILSYSNNGHIFLKLVHCIGFLTVLNAYKLISDVEISYVTP